MAKKNGTPETDPKAQATAALQAYTAAMGAVEKLQTKQATELKKANEGVQVALKELYDAVGGQWFQLDGELVMVRKNHHGYYLRGFPTKQPEAVMSLTT